MRNVSVWMRDILFYWNIRYDRFCWLQKLCRNSGIFPGVVFFIPNWQEAGIEYRDSKDFICIIQILPKTVLHRGVINLELITNEHEELYMGICEWKSFCWIWCILRTFWFWKKYHPKRVGMNWWFELHCL